MASASYTLLDSVLASALAGGVATTVGGLPVYLFSRLSRPIEKTLMGFGAGVMLAASAFSLLLPGLERGELVYASGGLAALIVAASFLAGGGLIALAHARFPHEHFFKGVEGPETERLSRLWLFIIAITLHNFPEGLAVGVSFAAGEVSASVPLAIGIAAQNIPEGLVVAIAMTAAGYSRSRALAVTALTGFVEPLGALVGHLGAAAASSSLPIGLGLAAGAMVFVVSDEIIPESHAPPVAGRATLGLMVGFALMMVLDVALGG